MNPYDPLPPETLFTNAKSIFQSRAYHKTPYRTESKYRLWDWLIWQNDLLASQCGLYPEHTRCWGAFIVRVSYDNDDLFARAVRAIRRIMLARIHEERDAWVARDIEETGHPPEPLPAEKDFSMEPDIGPGEASRLTEMYRDFVRPYIEAKSPGSEPVTLADVFAGELLQMHHNMVLEDREALDGADLDSAFLYQAAYLEKRNIFDHAANRGGFFVYLDKESIERLAQVPDDEAMAVMTRDEEARLGWETWVKIVSMEGQSDPEDLSDWPVYTGVSGESSALRRLRLPLWFDFLGAVGDRRMEGMDYEGEGYERGPGSAEWTFTPPNHYEFPGKSERMEALYGPRKRGRY